MVVPILFSRHQEERVALTHTKFHLAEILEGTESLFIFFGCT